MNVENKLPPVVPGIFVDKEYPELLGGHCPICDLYQFPKSERCCRCFGQVDDAALGGSGAVYSVTTIRSKPPLGLPMPYRVGYVDLERVPLRVFALIDPALDRSPEIGQRVQLAVSPMGENALGQPCRRPYFTTVNS